MNWGTVIWSASLGASLTLAAMHSLVWLKARRLGSAHLAIAVSGCAAAAVTVFEMQAQHSVSPEAFAVYQRWQHVPLFFLVLSITAFIWRHFGTATLWLGVATVVVRLVSLAVNFTVPQNLHYRRILSLREVDFFGEKLRVVGSAIPNPWNRVAELSSLLLIVYVADASVRLWRGGGTVNRRRALVIGGSVIVFVLLAAAHGMLVHFQVIHSPYIISFLFLSIVLAMAHELSHDVIQAARLGSELGETQNQMSLAAKAAQLALWTWDIPENRVWTTPEGRAIYGFRPDEPLTLDRFLQVVHEHDKTLVAEGLDHAIESGSEFAFDYRIHLPDGRTRWIRVLGSPDPVVSGRPVKLRGVSRDVTERRQAEEKFRLMVESAPCVMVMCDAAGRSVLVNHRVEDVFGYTPSELLGQPLAVLIPDEAYFKHNDWMRPFVANPGVGRWEQGREVPGRHKDGRAMVLEVGLNAARDGSEPYVLVSIVDVTEARATERKLAEQRSELMHLSRVSSLGQLSAALAHELNQPLSIILSNAQAAQRRLESAPPDPSELREILADIVTEGRRAGEVIQGLRALLRRGEVRLAAIEVNAMIEGVVRLMHSDLVARGVTIDWELAGELPKVRGDGVQLQQVILNLILNGCDAMVDSAPGERRLRIATDHRGPMVRITLSDHGCGLPAGGVDIFQPFFTTKIQGIGIGLAICRSIVEGHQGNLYACANDGAGASLILELPVLQHSC